MLIRGCNLQRQEQPGAGAEPARIRNVGTCVGASVGMCVGPDRLGTSVGPAYRTIYGNEALVYGNKPHLVETKYRYGNKAHLETRRQLWKQSATYGNKPHRTGMGEKCIFHGKKITSSNC